MATSDNPEATEALNYFFHQRTQAGSTFTVSTGTPEAQMFRDCLGVASTAANALNGTYGRGGLEHLQRNGFSINETVVQGYSRTVLNAALGQLLTGDSLEFNGDVLTQGQNVLSAYVQILPLEEKLKEHRKLRALDEAMKINGR